MRCCLPLGAGLMLGLGASCLSSQAYLCSSNEECDLSVQGQCEPTGGCSYPDDSCASGQRYSNSAPGSLAGQCTGNTTTTSSEVTSAEVTSADVTSSGSMSAETTSADSTSADSTPADSTSGGPIVEMSWRRVITLAGHPMGPVEDVPVRVSLTVENFDFDRVPNPDALRFFAPDEATLLPHEIELWGEDRAEIWVRADVDVEETTLWMWHDPADPGSAPSPADVWTQARGVWHMNGDLVDATSNGSHGSVLTSVLGPGRIGNGLEYDGSGFDELPLMGSSAEGSVELWFRANSRQPENLAMLFHAADDPDANGFNPTEELSVDIRRQDPDDPWARLIIGPEQMGSPHTNPAVVGPWLDEEWHHIVASWSSRQSDQIWVDGRLTAIDNDDIDLEYSFGEFVRLGGTRTTENRNFSGTMDEVRFYETRLTHAQAMVRFAAQADQFAGVGPEQPLP